MGHAPRKHVLSHAQYRLAMSGIAGQVVELARVRLQIEQERRQARKVNVFEALLSQNAESALIELDVQGRFGVLVLDIPEIVFPMG